VSPPKPLTPEAELARLRRREKKILSDQIRERKIQKKQGLRNEKGQATPPEKTVKIPVWCRQKWREVPVEGTSWAKFRRYLKRTFHLKQWRWRFDESLGEGWCLKLQNPFSVDPAKRYRIVLLEKRGPRVGKQRSHPTKEQRKRPNSRDASQAPANPFYWSPPPDEKHAPDAKRSPLRDARRDPPPPPSFGVHRYPEPPILPPPVEYHPELPRLPEPKKRTAADFSWRPSLVDFKLKITFWDTEDENQRVWLVQLPANATTTDIERRLSECYEGRRFTVTYSKGPRFYAVSEEDPDKPPPPSGSVTATRSANIEEMKPNPMQYMVKCRLADIPGFGPPG
jgi:hypothetical protein